MELAILPGQGDILLTRARPRSPKQVAQRARLGAPAKAALNRACIAGFNLVRVATNDSRARSASLTGLG